MTNRIKSRKRCGGRSSCIAVPAHFIHVKSMLTDNLALPAKLGAVPIHVGKNARMISNA
jgi:hypothetical protein